VPEGMKRVGVEGQLLGHEADFDEGTDAVLQQAIVNLVDVSEVVDGVAVLVEVVDAHLVVKDCVEAHVLEVRDLPDGAHVIAIALAQRENGAAGAEHLIPEVRKGCGRRLRIDMHDFLRATNRKGGEKNQKEKKGPAQASHLLHEMLLSSC